MTNQYVTWITTLWPPALIAVLVVGIIEFFFWRPRRYRRRRSEQAQDATAPRLVSLREILWRKPVPHGIFGSFEGLEQEPYSLRHAAEAVEQTSKARDKA